MTTIHRTRGRDVAEHAAARGERQEERARRAAVRRHTIAPSEKSSSATLMNMYDDPQTAAFATSMSQERRVTHGEASGARAARQSTSWVRR